MWFLLNPFQRVFWKGFMNPMYRICYSPRNVGQILPFLKYDQ